MPRGYSILCFQGAISEIEEYIKTGKWTPVPAAPAADEEEDDMDGDEVVQDEEEDEQEVSKVSMVSLTRQIFGTGHSKDRLKLVKNR